MVYRVAKSWTQLQRLSTLTRTWLLGFLSAPLVDMEPVIYMVYMVSR